MNEKNEGVKTAVEIGMMAGQLNTANQNYVLNTVNALLFSQQVNESEQPEHNKQAREGGKKGKVEKE